MSHFWLKFTLPFWRNVPRVKKTVKKIKLEGAWGELEARSCFQRQSFTKYLRQPLIFMFSISVFQGIFTSTDKIFILVGRLSSTQYFYEVLRFFWYFLSLKLFSNSYIRIYYKQSRFVSHVVKGNFAQNYQKVSKYYEHDCRFLENLLAPITLQQS